LLRAGTIGRRGRGPLRIGVRQRLVEPTGRPLVGALRILLRDGGRWLRGGVTTTGGEERGQKGRDNKES
jgi:hypothetical protein